MLFEEITFRLSEVSTESGSDRVSSLHTARRREDEYPVAIAPGTDLITATAEV